MHQLPATRGSRACVVSGMKGFGDGDFKVVAMLAPDNTGCRGEREDWSIFPDHHVMWANRKLISAAPDLLAAVKVLMVAVAGEPGALGSDARSAVALASKAVRKALEGDDAPDDGAYAIAHADEMLDALRAIRDARDVVANGAPPPWNPDEKCFDDWAADLASEVIAKAEGAAHE